VTAEQIKALLKLDPHPIEGGSFRQTWAAPGTLDLPRGTRSQGTAIYYLLEQDQFSEMHMLESDEIFHFYVGDPVEMVQLFPDGDSAVLRLGHSLMAGEQVQVLVPAGVWQGTRLIGDGKLALLGCTVVPGFDYAAYHSASYKELAAKWPEQKDRIRALTRT
jgi:predicted cupin superfamily sugar epimerase